jgi:5-methylthioribose kinase
VSLRSEAVRAHPEFPWLDPGRLDAIRDFLAARRWLECDELLLVCEKAGEGNMNLTLRVRTTRRTFILKQARPWVEKYDAIAAPWDRMLFEQRFYERVRALPEVASRMPRFLAADPAARAVLLEYLPGASDCTGIYGGKTMTEGEVRELAVYLRALHDGTHGAVDLAEFANRAMRALNHDHIFVIPLAPEHGLPLEGYERGLDAAAASLKADRDYVTKVREAGARYLGDGPCLVHGDFFPGSWLRSAGGLRVIDPEFCFAGSPEFDLGCAVAHLVLGRQPAASIRFFLAAYTNGAARGYDAPWVARYAAAEIMRRLIGVAQLPIPASTGVRAELLERSRWAMLAASLAPLAV